MFDRWGMTAVIALELTGVAVTDAQLEAAEDEIRDYLGVVADPDRFGTAEDDVRTRAMGRAIAWQAAYRATGGTRAAGTEAAAVTSESIGGGDYSVTYARPRVDDPEIEPQAHRLLARTGWTALARSGMTRA